MTVCASLSAISVFLCIWVPSRPVQRYVPSRPLTTVLHAQRGCNRPVLKALCLVSFAISFSVSVRVGSMPLKGLFPALTWLISSWMAAVSVNPSISSCTLRQSCFEVWIELYTTKWNRCRSQSSIPRFRRSRTSSRRISSWC